MALSPSKAVLTRVMHDDGLIATSGAWAKEARQSAAARAQSQGLPERRDEYWKYTRPDLFTQKSVTLKARETSKTSVFQNQLHADILFENGILISDALPEVVNCSIESLANAAALDHHWVRDIYGKRELEGQSPVKRSLAALNTATASQGVLVHARENVSNPIRIHAVCKGSVDAVIHHVVKVEAGASVTLVETGQYGARCNVVMEVEVADTGSFHHIRVQDDHEHHTITHIFARVGADSTFKSFTLTSGGQMTRNECILELVGDNSAVSVSGACLGDNDCHHDDTVFITHDAVNCESRQVFKKVLRNGAVGVFQGKILVKAGAQKTDGYQISQSLLLDEDSQFLAKPELEIYADDVACSHGSTCGAIDEQALFYLRSRGIPEPKAVDLLTLSFVAQAIEEIEDLDIAAAILGHLTETLEVR